MTTVRHPKHITTKHQEQLLTTYDSVSGSPTKLKYSFGASKEKRFPSVKLRNHEQVGYTIPSTKTTRAAGFGIGDRFVQRELKLKKNINPSPDKYTLPSTFNPDNTTSTFAVHVKGDTTYCFGTGRGSYSKTVLNRSKLGADMGNPGPGSYEPLQPLGKDAKAFTLKGKLNYEDPAKWARKHDIPGPGAHSQALALDKYGVYNQNSEFNNSKASKWGPAHDRFKYPRLTPMETPGPHYDQAGEVYKGTQVNSSYHSVKTPGFGFGGRSKLINTRFCTPGPGSYRPPSDFGYVDVRKFSLKPMDLPGEEKDYGQGEFHETSDKVAMARKIRSSRNSSVINKRDDALSSTLYSTDPIKHSLQISTKRSSISPRKGQKQAWKTATAFHTGKKKTAFSKKNSTHDMYNKNLVTSEQMSKTHKINKIVNNQTIAHNRTEREKTAQSELSNLDINVPRIQAQYKRSIETPDEKTYLSSHQGGIDATTNCHSSMQD